MWMIWNYFCNLQAVATDLELSVSGGDLIIFYVRQGKITVRRWRDCAIIINFATEPINIKSINLKPTNYPKSIIAQ